MKMRRTSEEIVWSWLFILLYVTTTSTTIARAQLMAGAGGTPWIVPFGIASQEEERLTSSSFHDAQKEFFASALVYDSQSDRIYVTGVSNTRTSRTTTTATTGSDTSTIPPTDDDGQYQDDDAYYSNNADDNYGFDTHSNFNDVSPVAKSDCFLGILQVPRRTGSNGDFMDTTSPMALSNDWIRQHTHIGTRESQEACSGIDIVRRGNDHKVYLIGHSVFGPSTLENQLYWYNSTHQTLEPNNTLAYSNNSSDITNSTNATNITANKTTTTTTKTPVVYGFVMDVTWYNGHVPTGYLMHHVPVEYPIGITASSISSNEDIYVASIQSLSGIVNPAHTMYETMKRQIQDGINNTNATEHPMLFDTTTSGSYVPPAYGESYSFHLRRIGERSQSLIDIMTLPGGNDSVDNTTLYESKIEGSKLLNLLKLSKQIKTTESSTVNHTTATTVSINTTNTTNITSVNATAKNSSLTVDDTSATQPLSFGEYRFVVEPLVERWGRTFSANIQEETSTTTTVRPALYSIQVSSLLRCTITTLVESNVAPSVRGVDDDGYTDDDQDDNSDDDAITYVQRQQDMIFVAGSTRGSGLALGGEVGDTSLHGFVTSFDANTGVLLRRMPILTTSSVTATSSSNTVSRSSGYTVRVFGMCQQDPYSRQTEMSNFNSDHYIYVVGMTDGILDHQAYATQQQQSSALRVGVYQAFIQKINAATLSVQWTKQLGATKFLNGTNTTQYGSIHGISCAVTPDGFHVYLGGTVLSGATITPDGGSTTATKSYGRDDIFVAQYMTSDGKLNYVKQIGTPQDDTLANGVSLVADKYGNAIVLGNSRGSLFGLDTFANLTNKVILLSIDRGTGNHVDISGETEPTEELVESTTSQQPTPGPQVALDNESSISSWSDLSRVNVVYICVLGILTTAILVSVVVSCYTCRQRNRTDKMISRYLLSLAAEDSINKKNSRRDNGANVDRMNDVEHAKLFTKGEYDREYATESSYDDDYETVSFVPASQQGTEQTSLHAGPVSSYKDTLLHFNSNVEEQTKDRMSASRTSLKKNVRTDFNETFDDDPLRRWLVRDP